MAGLPRHPSMRGPLSSAAGADFVSRASRTSPFAVGFGRSGPSQTRPRTIGRATRNTSPEPEAEGGFASLHAGSVRRGSRRDVIRSTIYPGSPGLPDVATKPVSKGRHHSVGRSSAMGPLSGCLPGSSTWSSRPPACARRLARSLDGILIRLLSRFLSHTAWAGHGARIRYGVIVLSIA
jgi:hypothetical protein